MKQLLLVSYFWPPSGKATIHWPLFISKYLRNYNWDTSVLTVEEDTFSAKDESLLTVIDPTTYVVSTKPYDPFRIYRKFIGKREDEPLVASETISKKNKSLKHKIAVWIRMNLFVPDARVGWILSAPSGGKKIIAEKHPSVIVSIGPPHSSHLVAMRLSNRYKIPFIPVLIDPWVDIAYYRDFKRLSLTVRLDNFFEEKVLRTATHVIFVTNDTKDHYCRKYSFLSKKSSVCYWGYNEEYFSGVKKQPSDEIIILHAGNIFDFQNPSHLWGAIKQEIDNGKKICLRFVGTVSPGIRQAITNAGLKPFTTYVGFLPYPQVVQEMMNASYLLVCATERRHVPGKLFEYMRTGNRIIAFGDDNDEVQQLLNSTSSGIIFPYSYHCNDIFIKLQEITPLPQNALLYCRERIAQQVADIFEKIVTKTH